MLRLLLKHPKELEIKKIILLFLLLSLISSCGVSNSSNPSIPESNSIETTPPPSTFPIKIRRSSSGRAWKSSYSNSLIEIFSEQTLDKLFTANINQYDLNTVGCPNFTNFNHEEKKWFYIAFIAAIAEAESDYEVAQKTYNKADGTLNIGLLQIDQASADRHGGKIFNRDFTSEDLKNPDLNLKVGAVILKHQITNPRSPNRLFPAIPYYWQVLTGTKLRFLRNIKTNLALLKSCKA